METVIDRLRLVAMRFVFAFGVVAVLVLGSAGPFSAHDWPPLIREMVFGYLGAFLVTRIANLPADPALVYALAAPAIAFCATIGVHSGGGIVSYHRDRGAKNGSFHL
jgi:hypothetical protein